MEQQRSAGGYILLLTVLALAVGPASAQRIRCYSLEQGDCSSRVPALGLVSTSRDCCVGTADGYFFDEVGIEACFPCVVLGFSITDAPMAAPSFTGPETGAPYTLNVTHIKNQFAAPSRLTFDVTSNASDSSDFRITTTQVLLSRAQTEPSRVPVIFSVDGVALEEDETYEIRLETTTNFGSNQFLIDTVSITIVDQDVVTIRFTELDYRVREHLGPVPVALQRDVQIATPIVLMVTPLNYTEFIDSGTPLPPDFPEIGDAANATSFPEERRDFSIEPLILVFNATESPSEDKSAPVPIFDDVINEATEIFIVTLSLVRAVNPDGVNLAPRNASLCRIVDNDDIRIGFEFPDYSYPEASVTISDPSQPDFPPIYITKEGTVSEQTFDIVISTIPGVPPATFGVDYTIGVTGNQEFQFKPEDQRLLFPVVLFEDQEPENNEAFQLEVSNQLGGASFIPGDNPATIVTIVDTDGVLAELLPTSVSVSEGAGTVELCVNVTTPPPNVDISLSFFVDISTVALTAGSSDFEEIGFANSPLVVPFGQTNRFDCFNVTIIDDGILEFAEEFTVLAEVDTPGVRVQLEPNRSSIIITDNDEVIIGFTQSDVSVTEGSGMVTLNVSVLSGDFAMPIYVNFSTTSGTAFDTSDYTSVSDRLEFLSAQDSHLVTISIADDSIYEELQEVFTAQLVLDSPDLAAISISPSQATVTIIDDDTVTIGFVQTQLTVNESVGSVTVGLELTSGTLQDGVSIDVDITSTDGSARVGVDYTFDAERVSFTSGVLQFSPTVEIIADTVTEREEFFLLDAALSDPSLSGRILVQPGRAEIMIRDDDSVVIGFRQTVYPVDESSLSGQVVLTVDVIQGTIDQGETILVNFTTEDGTADGGDVDYSTTTVQLGFIAAQSQDVAVAISDDELLELEEDFFCNLLLVTTGLDVSVSPERARVTIQDEDSATIGFNPSEYSTGEDGGSVGLRVELITGQLGRSVEVLLNTRDGTATAGLDYIGVFNQSLVFSSTSNFSEVAVSIVNDTTLEVLEVFFASLEIQSAEPRGVILAPIEATVDIQDNDAATIGFEPAVYTVGEDGRSINLTIKVLDGTLQRNVRCRLDTRDGTAIAGLDYGEVSSRFLDFSAAADELIVLVSIVNDMLVESDERFFADLTLVSSDATGVTVAPDTAVVTITDEDRATIGFIADSYDVLESDGFVTVEVTVREGTLGRDVVVTLQTSDGTAISTGPEADFTMRVVNLTFSRSVTVHRINISIINDLFLEEDELLQSTVSLVTSEDGVTLMPAITTITILNDDVVVIGFERSMYSVEVGADDVIQTIGVIIVQGQLRIGVDVRVYTEEGSATDGQDYVGFDQVVTFNQGVSRVDFNITIRGDQNLEPVEEFVGLLETSDADVVLNPNRTIIQILDTGTVLFSFRQGMYIFIENVMMAEVCVDKIGSTTQTLSVMISGAFQSQVGGVIDQVLTYPPSETEHCISFPVEDDQIALEDVETLVFRLSLIDSVPGVQLGEFNTTFVMIMDNDELQLTLELNDTFPESVGSAEACVFFDKAFATDFQINAVSNMPGDNFTADAIATPDVDFESTNRSLRAASTQEPGSRVCFTFDILDDSIVEEPLEDFTLSIALGRSAPEMIQLAVATRQSQIADDDSVVIGFVPDSFSAPESSRGINFVVVVTGGILGRAVEADFTTSDGTAVAGSDYQSPGRIPLQFDSQTRNRTVLVFVIDDSILEDDETFFGNLTTDDPAVTLGPDLAEATIIEDNDSVTIGFQPSDVTVFESEATAILTVVLISGQLERSVSIDFATIPGTATVDADYQSESSPFVFPSDQLFVDIPVSIINDSIVESSETFFGSLGNSMGEPIVLAPDFATVTIIDANDTVTIGFESTTYTTEEGTTVEVCAVIISGMLEREAVVTLTSRDGSAEAGADYTAVNSDLTFNEAVSRVCRNVSTEEDDILEEDEQFLLDLTTSDPDVVVSVSEATVTITDDDGVTIGLEETSFTVDEGELVEVCVILINGTLEREVTVTLQTSSGTASVGDFTAVDIDLVFDATTSRHCVNITTLEDDTYEDSERFDIILTTLDPDVTPLPDTGEVTILDDDGVTIGFVESSYTVNETMPGFVDLCARLTAGTLATSVDVEFSTASGSAEAPSDYVTTMETFTFTDSQPVCARVPIVDDSGLEGSEDFFGQLSTFADRVTLNPDETRVIIVDDDGVTIGFRQEAYTVGEAEGTVTLNVDVLSGELMQEVQVRFFTESGTASAPDDYETSESILTFSGSVTSQAVTVEIENDLIDENDEVFFGRLERITDARVAISPDEALVTIVDDDNVTIGLEETEIVVDEDVGTVQICVRLITGELDREITVTLSAMDGSAVATDDYSLQTVLLTFNSTVIRLCTEVEIVDDTTFEGNETFTVSITTDDTETTLDPPSTTIVILDNDDLGVRFGAATYTFVENEVAGFIEVVRVGTAGIPFTVLVQGGPSAQTDVEVSASGVSKLITFQAGSASPNAISVRINLTDDDVALEAVESYVASLILPPGTTGVRLLDPRTTEVNVLDDDAVTVGFGSAGVSVVESQGYFTMCVVKDKATSSPVAVEIVDVQGTALRDIDYLRSSLPTTVTLQPDADRACFNGTILDDMIAAEFIESFDLEITSTSPSDQVQVGQRSTEITIVDDDSASVRFERPSYVAFEGSVVEVCLIKDLETAQLTSLFAVTQDETAISPGDYISGRFPVVFPTAANQRVCVSIETVLDTELEPIDESFLVTMEILLGSSLGRGSPNMTRVFITGAGTQVNDTVIGDPLLTVPINVVNIADIGYEELSLCYEIHGTADSFFNLVTDECLSVNAHYFGITNDLNIIDAIGIRAVDNSSECINIDIQLENCAVSINGVILTGDRYEVGGVSVRRARRGDRVRVRVPNCNDLSVVMYTVCQRGQRLDDVRTGDVIEADMIKFEVTRGLNFGHRDAHGIIGQFWNQPFEIEEYTGLLRGGAQPESRYTLHFAAGTDNSRSFTGFLYSISWEYKFQPCIYVGNRQGGPVYEVEDPNDSVIEGFYTQYIVQSLFQSSYTYGLFDENRCV